MKNQNNISAIDRMYNTDYWVEAQKNSLEIMENNKYNGYTNYETWNVALWIDNDQKNYNLMMQCNYYEEFVDIMHSKGKNKTGDGVLWNDPKVNVEEINELIFNDR